MKLPLADLYEELPAALPLAPLSAPVLGLLALLLALLAPVPTEPPAPGSLTRVFNCTPSGTGPSGFAGQEPAGLTDAPSPRGMFPV